MVDFLKEYIVESVNITNRITNPERLANFTVQVSMNNPLWYPGFPAKLPGEKCFYRGPAIPGNASQVISCIKPITGRYLTVFKPANSSLAICELEVFATNVSGKQMYGTQFQSMPNKKLTLAPFAVFHKVRSVLECTSQCLKIKNGTVTAVQVKSNPSICECIQFSYLTATPTSFENNTDWRLYMSKLN
ncbi:unnamed protein product [Candidula unifasciata]|uniref:F5/8 type C domain-containing protein n=1 Tax=Candidula unifasciata TaxID=100452 RepID=A0A8S3YPA6_9EUPU|nr:unnamed protein product [Candidula unifasciata]